MAGALLQSPEAQHSGLMWMPALKLEEEEEGWLKIWCLLDYVNLFQNLQCQECCTCQFTDTTQKLHSSIPQDAS